MVREKVQWLLKALPKALRNRETPLTAVVTDFGRLRPSASQAPSCARIRARWKCPYPRMSGTARTPSHLLVNVRVVDARQGTGHGRDLRVKNQLGRPQLTFSAATRHRAYRPQGLDCGDLPAALSFIRDARRLTGYPALVDEGDTVAVRLLDTADASERAHRLGVLRLLRIVLNSLATRKGLAQFNAVALYGPASRPTACAKPMWMPATAPSSATTRCHATPPASRRRSSGREHGWRRCARARNDC
jgi:ATP-dependent helicase HrpA